MKALILGSAIFLVFGLPAMAERPSPSPNDIPDLKVPRQTPSRPHGPATIPSKNGWNIDLVDPVEVGWHYSVHISGDVAYVGYAEMLAVLDITDPAAPEKIGFTFFPGAFYHIERSGDYLYCVGGVPQGYSLVIVDISDNTAPLIVHTRPAQGSDMDVDGDYLYLEHGNGLRIFDISDPVNPTLLGFCSSSGVTDILARNGLVYVARGIAPQPGLQIVDATNPTTPTQVIFFPVSGGAYHIDLSGDYLYMVTYHGPNTFNVVDVSVPSAPSIVSSIPGLNFFDVAVEGQYAFVGDNYDFFHVFDVSNPESPVALPPLEAPCGTWTMDLLDVNGDIAALGVDNYGICFVDISVPSNPTDLASHEALPWAHSLDLSGSRLVISLGYGRMALVDRYDPSIRTIVTGHAGAIDGSQVAVRGNYAYMTVDDSNYNTYDGLEIFDISDPANAVSVGHMYTPWFPSPLSVGANHAYIAPSGALWVIDVSNPSLPTKVGELAMPVGNLFADEPYLYVTTSGYLRVIDVANPSLPTLVASLPLSGSVWDLWLDDSIVYVAAEQALQIVDVSDPLQPLLIESFPTTEAYSVVVRGDYAYLSAGDYLRIVDVSDPSNPAEVGNIETPYFWNRVAVAPPYIYAVTYYGPLLIFETPLITSVPSTAHTRLTLEQNYPNPFNPSTTIAFEIPAPSQVRVDIFDVRGSLVRTLVEETMPSGPHTITWDGRDSNGNPAPSGVYLCRLAAGGRTVSKKMVILK